MNLYNMEELSKLLLNLSQANILTDPNLSLFIECVTKNIDILYINSILSDLNKSGILTDERYVSFINHLKNYSKNLSDFYDVLLYLKQTNILNGKTFDLLVEKFNFINIGTLKSALHKFEENGTSAEQRLLTDELYQLVIENLDSMTLIIQEIIIKVYRLDLPTSEFYQLINIILHEMDIRHQGYFKKFLTICRCSGVTLSNINDITIIIPFLSATLIDVLSNLKSFNFLNHEIFQLILKSHRYLNAYLVDVITILEEFDLLDMNNIELVFKYDKEFKTIKVVLKLLNDADQLTDENLKLILTDSNLDEIKNIESINDVNKLLSKLKKQKSNDNKLFECFNERINKLKLKSDEKIIVAHFVTFYKQHTTSKRSAIVSEWIEQYKREKGKNPFIVLNSQSGKKIFTLFSSKSSQSPCLKAFCALLKGEALSDSLLALLNEKPKSITAPQVKDKGKEKIEEEDEVHEKKGARKLRKK